MNHYELNKFIPNDASELIRAFKNGKTITNGCISVFDDSIGKPGDRIVELKNIENENNRIVFEFFGNEKIVVEKPSHIVINEKVIGIQDCEKINWMKDNLYLIYEKENDLIIPKAIDGEHFFRIKQNSNALLFYTW